MNLRWYCLQNNICCATCIQSYKNYISENNYNMFCGCGGSLVSDKYVCMDYESRSPINFIQTKY
jgi:hypothetical protein